MSSELYSKHVNDQWVRLLDVLGMERDYVRCEGTRLTTAAGREVLDFLSGYCVYNTGHNHPRILDNLVLSDRNRPGPSLTSPNPGQPLPQRIQQPSNPLRQLSVSNGPGKSINGLTSSHSHSRGHRLHPEGLPDTR